MKKGLFLPQKSAHFKSSSVLMPNNEKNVRQTVETFFRKDFRQSGIQLPAGRKLSLVLLCSDEFTGWGGTGNGTHDTTNKYVLLCPFSLQFTSSASSVQQRCFHQLCTHIARSLSFAAEQNDKTYMWQPQSYASPGGKLPDFVVFLSCVLREMKSNLKPGIRCSMRLLNCIMRLRKSYRVSALERNPKKSVPCCAFRCRPWC